MTTSRELTLKDVQDAVSGHAAAFRSITEYQPAGGEGDKVFPPTYEGGKYAVEQRRLPGFDQPVDCVLIDSVQSQANRMELALLEAWERGRASEDVKQRFPLPVITVDFAGNEMPKVLRITSLEAPHRIADALLRDSLHDGTPFRVSSVGKELDNVDNRNATALFQYCPTTLVFGVWDSTGPKGGLGAKFARAMVSEMVGYHAVVGVKTSSRIDPAEIRKGAGPVFRTQDGQMTTVEKDAVKVGGKPALFALTKKGELIPYDSKKDQDDAKPSKANHGNIPPAIKSGGATITKALQTTVLSLPALRRLRFPLAGESKPDPNRDNAARTVLAALGLCAATLPRESGCDLRSRCQLHPTEAILWQLLDKPGAEPVSFKLSGDAAIELYRGAVDAAKKAKLPWLDDELVLKPSPSLVQLVKKSQLLATSGGEGDE